ncbi:HET-domain-containing protein [Decorospora gaudefroyi]|uniref:HET-domain-containing protein n=1 Tax=Decorospora gaudefroyi TaxID=184978 RepID=A0A6A5K9B1_9PLEO|nr:HET-domain-containing protein [Decorospora gaudefroyi]
MTTSSSSVHNFTFRYPPPWERPSNEPGSDSLCIECARLDLDQSFANAFRLYEGARRGDIQRPLGTYRKDNGPVYLRDFFFVTSLGNRLSHPENCTLCTFFAQMTKVPGSGSHKLMAFCSSESHLIEPRKKDVRGRYVRRPWEAIRHPTAEAHDLAMSLEHNIFMAVVPEIATIPKTGVPVRWFETDLPDCGSIYRLTAPETGIHRLVTARKIQPKAQFGLMRAWLSRCRCHHGSCSSYKPDDLVLPGFRVIDCHSRNYPPDIISRPWTKGYVALSYVWGNRPHDDWAPTIMDAIEVTKRLGERYLWVDRTCIDQSNLEEKEQLISKMDAVYAGAEFTIVCAAGDARTGLPGVNTTPRRMQPFVELAQRSSKAKGKSASRFEPDSFGEFIGITEEEYAAERAGESGWLDDQRFGLRPKMTFDFAPLLEDDDLMKKYDIPERQLLWHREMADDFGYDSVEPYLEKVKELARRMGIPLKGMINHLQAKMAGGEGFEFDSSEEEIMPMARAMVDSSKPRRLLPSNKTEDTLTLVSTMQDPRVTIKNSVWNTRGWTYQEGVLSKRRLVFTEEQVYWECCGMAVCETVDLALSHVHEPSGSRMGDYMLSGIFEGDLHQAEESQYGFERSSKDDVGEQVVTLGGHIQTYTSRNLGQSGDSLRAFMGVAATYTTNAGLCLLLGLPVWAGAFANDEPGLQHSFALSLSSWTHKAHPVQTNAKMYAAECPRREKFPSWTWAGWQGRVEFCNEKQSQTHKMHSTNGMVGTITVLPGPPVRNGDLSEVFETDSHTLPTDPWHSDFFKCLTQTAWVFREIWSPEMRLHTPDHAHSAWLTGWTPVHTIGDPSLSWHLTINKPLVLQHLYLEPSTVAGEWRRLGGRAVSVHLSVPITEEQLVMDHVSGGHLVSVLVFASMIPDVFNGIARYLILRRADSVGCWERIGRMNMWITEKEMNTFKDPGSMVEALPVIAFGADITIV